MLIFKKLYFGLLIGSILCSLPLSGAPVTSATKNKHSASSAFIAKKDNMIIEIIGKCDNPHPPYSTFKVPLALMAFDAGILENKDSPKWSFKEEYEKNFQNWYTHETGLKYHWCEDHTPATFMKYSVVWFSHQITQRLGKEKFQMYVTKLNYGNKDVSGNPGKDDGLLNSWLGTSLAISPREQAEFLEKLSTSDLPPSKGAQEKTKEIMKREEEWNGWQLYGKTGASVANTGWFIGWVKKNGQQIVFAQYLDLEDPNLDLTNIPKQQSLGLTAKEVAKKNILKFLQ